MRITNSMLVNSMLNNIYNNQSRMNKLQQQLATGKKITEASDDPVIAARSLKLRTDVAEIEQYQRNTSDGGSWMDTTESALSNMTDIMQRVRELTVQGANGVLKSGDTKMLGQEMAQLKIQLVQNGNSSYAGRYVFSGFETSKKLLIDDEKDPNFGAFNISANSVEEKIVYNIGVGDSININVCGGDLFNYGSDKPIVGSATGSTALSFPKSIVAGINDTLSLSIDGVETVDITIPPSDYTDLLSLTTAIQSQINSVSSIAKDITVSSSGNKIRFTSGTQGTGSEIRINNTDLLSTSNATLGVDKYVTSLADGNAVGGKNGITRGNDYIAFPVTITGGVNDSLDLNIDGVEDVSINIPANTYNDIDSLALAIQTEVNNTSIIALDISVSPLGNKLQFDSGTVGRNSVITINSDPAISTAVTDLGLETTTVKVGTQANKGKLIDDMDALLDAFNKGDNTTISSLLSNIDEDLQNIIRIRADLGARSNRVNLTSNRLSADSVTFTKLMSENEDADMAEVIMKLQNEENVYKASLAGGAKIIQPSLIDFLR